MTHILLDTNALLWLVAAPEKIADMTRDVLADHENELIVSAVSAWEVAIKTRLGRLDGEPLLAAWAETLDSMNATELVIDSDDAAVAGLLTWEHRDPFDRMLVAQATRRSLTIATSDSQIISAALTPVLDTRR